MEIKVVNLSKSYGGKKVFENLSLTLCDEPVCLMAPSGWGKTTLLRIIMGLEKRDKGRVEMPERLRFSTVFQEDRLAPELSAVMNVAIVGGHPDRDEITALLAETGLSSEDSQKPVKFLSGGQKRRVAIVRALYSESDVVIMDEPFKGLDEDTAGLVAKRIKNHLDSRLLIVVTHREEDARALEAEIIKLRK